MVITMWYAERGDECGIIHLNDYAMGDLFGGCTGFEARLAKQGFRSVRNLSTPAEVETAKQPPRDKVMGDWGGPWETQYRWEINGETNE
jgi:hypothetical protein